MRSISLPVLCVCALAGPGFGIEDVDCNGNGVADLEESASVDCDQNGVPDECQLVGVSRGFVLAGAFPAASLSALDLGDVDGDKDLDVVGADRATGRLVVFVNDGAAHLGAPLAFEAGGGARALALADLDRDGDLDAVTANDASISLLRGDGAGRLVLDGVFPLGSGPVEVTTGDFDLDGDEDILTLNDLAGPGTPGNVSLFRQEDGTFGSPVNFAAGIDPFSMHAADLDGDGDLDLVISTLQFISGTMTSLRNEGGTFSKIQEVEIGWRDASVLANVVDDPSIDGFAVNHHLGNLTIYSGDASGGFTRWYTYWRMPFRVTTMVAADFEGDGDNDVIALIAEESEIVVFRNDRRHFTPTRRMPAGGGSPRTMAAGDLDGDGAPDLVLAVAQGVTVLLNVAGDFGPDCNGNELVDACESNDCNLNASPDACDVATGLSSDCDSNGIPDECDVPDCNRNGSPDRCDVESGASMDCNRNGRPDECEDDCNRNHVPDDCDVSAGTSEDCNRDSVPDDCQVAENDCNANGFPDDCDVADGRSPDCNANAIPDECDLVSVFRLEPVLHEVDRSWPLVDAADLDGDGLVDLVVADRAVQALVNAGDGTFRAGAEAPLAAEARRLIAEDLDGDGDEDVALGVGTNVALLWNDGGGTLGEGTPLVAGGQVEGLVAALIDGDGDLDLASLNADSGDLSLFLGDGQGGFAAASSIPVGAFPGGIAAADIDGDGRIDLVSSATSEDFQEARLIVQFNVGIGFTPGPGPVLPGFVRAIAAGDLDGDGRMDLAVSVSTCGPFSCSGDVIVLRNMGLGVLEETARFRSRFESFDLALADLDGDLDVDLVSLETLFRDDVGGGEGHALTVRRNDGTGAFPDRHDDPVGAEPRSVAVADFQGGALPELAVGARERVWILRNETGPYSVDQDANGVPDECSHHAFDRGDANGDGRFDITDPIRVLFFLFSGSDPLACLKAADSDDNGAVNITDAIRALLYLFAGTETIPEPFGACRLDPTPDPLGCEEFPPCG